MKKTVTALAAVATLAAAPPAVAKPPAQMRSMALAKARLSCLTHKGCQLRTVGVVYLGSVMGATPFDRNYDYGFAFFIRRGKCRGVIRYEQRGIFKDSLKMRSKKCR